MSISAKIRQQNNLQAIEAMRKFFLVMQYFSLDKLAGNLHFSKVDSLKAGTTDSHHKQQIYSEGEQCLKSF